MNPNPILPVCALSLLGLLGSAHAAVSTNNPNNDLIFVPVQQCRLVDTRASSGGDLVAGVPQNFMAYGKVASQGGNPAGCPQPKQNGGPAPVAISANITRSAPARLPPAFSKLFRPAPTPTTHSPLSTIPRTAT